MANNMMFVKAENFKVEFPDFSMQYPDCYPSSHYEISCEAHIHECEASVFDDDFRTLFNDGKYDITITDNRSNSITLYNKSIQNHLKITKRIPRKMKKDLKKKHGDLWLHFHPNTENEISFV